MFPLVVGDPWAQPGVGCQSLCVDNRPLQLPGAAETREYRLRSRDKGAPNCPLTPVRKYPVHEEEVLEP